MATRGVSTVVTYRAWDTSANTPKTGDALNHTLRWIKDGTSAAPTNSPSEVDSTNAPGVYKLTLTSTETDCVFGVLAGKSGTANISIFGVQVGFEYAPTSATTFGAFIGNATAALAVDASGRVDVSKVAGTAQTAKDLGASATQTGDAYARLGAPAGASVSADIAAAKANLATITGTDGATLATLQANYAPAKAGDVMKVSSGTGANQISLSSGLVTVGTNNDKTGYTASTVSDKTGYSLTQAFPTNFSSLAVTVGGAVTAGTVSDKTGYALTAAYDPAKTAAQAGDAMALTSAERNSTADALLGRNVAGGSSTGRLVKEALYFLRNKWSVSSGTLTVYGTDDTTSSWTATVGTDGTANPIVSNDPA